MGKETATTKETGKQKVWPIFVLALGLTAFGFYFVFFDAPDKAAQGIDGPPATAAEALTPPESTVDEPVVLSYRPGDRQLKISMTQTARRVEGEELQTTIAFELVDESVEPQDSEAAAYRRRYRNPRVTMIANGEAQGREVTTEVERLLEATVLEVGYAADGRRLRTEVVSSESAQLRPTLDLVASGLEFVFLPLPTEKINPGESWSIRLPASVDPEEVIEVEGDTSMAFDLRAITEERAFIGLRTRGTSRATWDDGEERSGHLEVTSTGEGEWVFDRTAGQPRAMRLVIEREVAQPDDKAVETATIVIRAQQPE